MTWVAETEPVPDGGDAADDPAIWLDPDDPEASLILGTNKKGDPGLLVYDLAGRRVSAYDGGPMNNVDLRTDVRMDGRSVVLVVASTVDGRSLEVLELDPDTRRLVPVPHGTVETGIRSSGVCLWHPPQGGVFAFATGGDGGIQQWALTDPAGTFDPTLVREFALDSRVEGCVADDATGTVFLAEEAIGLWRVGADSGASAEPELVDEVGSETGLASDVEGMAIARYDDGRSYLVVSSQGRDRFVVYELRGADGLHATGDFDVRDAEGVDDVMHTDGVDVAVGDFGDGGFGRGLLVVQDDDNEQPRGGEDNQNFKLVPWDAVEAFLGLD